MSRSTAGSDSVSFRSFLAMIIVSTAFTTEASRASAAATSSPDPAPESARAIAIGARNRARIDSFRRIILTRKGDGIMGELSDRRPGCGAAVRAVYAAGLSLYSKAIDAAAVRISSFPKGSGRQDDTFFHFTRTKAFMDQFKAPQAELLSSRAYEKVLLFQRTRPAELHSDANPSDYHSNWRRLFYLSEDRESIAFFSPYEIEFRVRDDARLVSLERGLWRRALREVGARHPLVAERCGTDFDTSLADAFGTIPYHALAFLIAEDSGIDAIDYGQANHWFQFVSLDSIVSATPKGATGGNSSIHGGGSISPLVEPDLAFLDEPLIQVVSARRGAVDVSDSAHAFLDGKPRETYKISRRFLGGSPNPSDANAVATEEASLGFKLVWRCLAGGDPVRPIGAPRTVDLPANDAAYGTTFAVDCAMP